MTQETDLQSAGRATRCSRAAARSARQWKDRAAALATAGATVLCIALVCAITIALVWKSLPILATKPLARLLLSSAWRPLNGEFGFFAFTAGTLWVTLLAMVISIPISLLTAIYIAEYAGKHMRGLAGPTIDLLAGIPPVVYGLWGVLAVVPLVGALGARLGANATGYTVLSGAVVLAIMVLPIMIAVSHEVLRSVPQAAREASVALGATKWQTVKHVVLPSVTTGIGAAIVLGFSRAIGETMAVLMVVGNVAKAPRSVFDPAYPLPALIANNYGEMMSIHLYDSAIMLAALILLVVVAGFNVAAALVLRRVRRVMG
jgi:phosphate transport system permease protein